MAKRRPTPTAARNRLPGPTPRRPSYHRLLPILLTPVSADVQDKSSTRPGAPIDYAYFPDGGVVLSALTVMQDGNAIEVATIGNEGLVGSLRPQRQRRRRTG